MMHAILIFITAIYYTLPQLMTDPTVINRLIIIPPCVCAQTARERTHSVSKCLYVCRLWVQ